MSRDFDRAIERGARPMQRRPASKSYYDRYAEANCAYSIALSEFALDEGDASNLVNRAYDRLKRLPLEHSAAFHALACAHVLLRKHCAEDREGRLAAAAKKRAVEDVRLLLEISLRTAFDTLRPAKEEEKE